LTANFMRYVSALCTRYPLQALLGTDNLYAIVSLAAS
jgi:hypothetical protein